MSNSLKSFLEKKHKTAMSVDIINEITFLNIGIPTINYVISGKPLTGGLPLSGKISLIFGGEGSGKTSLVLHIIAQAQKNNIPVVYLDTERSITKPRLKQFDIDISELIYMTPESMEQCFDIIEDICKKKEDKADDSPILIIWDSLAASPTMDEIERTSSQVEIASQAKVLSRNLRRIRGRIARSNSGLVLVQQARENMDLYGDSISFPGGKALSHTCDMILRVSALKPDEQGQGFKISTPKKNRIFRPFQNSTIRFLYSQGFTEENILASFCDLLANIGILKGSGWYYLQSDLDKFCADNNMTEKDALADTRQFKKFRKDDFVNRLMSDKDFYTEILTVAEEYISKNLIHVTKVMRDPDAVDENGKPLQEIDVDEEDEE